MRTTVEISAEQHRALSAIAQRRGVRGFSVLVQEALDTYLANLDANEVDMGMTEVLAYGTAVVIEPISS